MLLRYYELTTVSSSSLPDGFAAESPLEVMLARVASPSASQHKAAWATPTESRQEMAQNEAPLRETRVG